MELITAFKLATEATKEALASEYEQVTRQDAEARRPITPMLDFCMQRAGTRERAEAIFNHVLKNSRISYWPNPEVAPHLRDNREIKEVCSKHFLAPIKATEHLLIAQETNLTRTIDFLKKQNVWVIGLAGETKTEYDQADLTGPLALVVGNEGKGISRLVREHCDLLVNLPMRGQINSLNAAVAGSIALYEALRQRNKHSK